MRSELQLYDGLPRPSVGCERRPWKAVVRLVVIGVLLPASVQAELKSDVATHLLKKHCIECHNADKQEGGVNFEQLLTAELWDNQQVWAAAVDKVRSGEMPPEKSELTDKHRADLLSSLDAALIEAGETRRRTVGRVPLRRLTPEEYEYTLRDLLHLEHLYVKQNLPDQPTRGFFDQSFSNRAAAQTVSPAGIHEYVKVAEHAINMAGVFGEKPTRNRFVLTHGGFSHFKTPVGEHASYVGNTANRWLGMKLAPGERSNGGYSGWYRFHLKTQSIRFNEHAHVFEPFNHPIYSQLSTRTVDDQKVNTAVLISQPHRMTAQDGLMYIGRGNLMMSFLSQNDTGHKRWGPGVLFDEKESWLEGPIIDEWPPASYRSLYDDLPNCNFWDAKKMWNAGPSKMPEKRWHPRGDLRLEHARHNDQKMANYVVVSQKPEKDARRLLTTFMTRAFRRPVKPEEVDSYYELAQPGIEANIPFQDAIKPAYLAVLSSSEFLFLDEQPGKLNDFALANRLSYFLWRSMPDEALFEIAKSGKLHEPAVLETQVDRMLQDERAERFIESFANDWLQVDKVQAMPGTQNAWLAGSMKHETYRFLREMLRGDHDVINLIDSDFVVVDDKMAHYYGIEGVAGPEFRLVRLPAGSRRGGLMTQASVLDVTSEDSKTNPILRGAWVVRKIMGVHIPPPPPLPPQEEVPEEERPRTMREEIARHGTVRSCRDCHSKFDTVGFALEEFGPKGQAREFYPNKEKNKGKEVRVSLIYGAGSHRQWLSDERVETAGETHNGKSFEDVAGLKRILRQDEEHFARHLTSMLMAFATGENVQYSDRRDIDQIMAAQPGKKTLRSLILGVIQSRAFQEK